MAKSDSFFIRKTVDINNNNTFQQDVIDLGAYVDALGKSVLRIHNVQVTYSDNHRTVIYHQRRRRGRGSVSNHYSAAN